MEGLYPTASARPAPQPPPGFQQQPLHAPYEASSQDIFASPHRACCENAQHTTHMQRADSGFVSPGGHSVSVLPHPTPFGASTPAIQRHSVACDSNICSDFNNMQIRDGWGSNMAPMYHSAQLPCSAQQVAPPQLTSSVPALRQQGQHHVLEDVVVTSPQNLTQSSLNLYAQSRTNTPAHVYQPPPPPVDIAARAARPRYVDFDIDAAVPPSNADESCKKTTSLPKLPPFKPHRAALWFKTVEDIFDIYELNEEMRFISITSALFDFDDLIVDLVGQPRRPGKYEHAKSTILRRLGHTNAAAVRRVLHKENMGKKSPSQFWRHLRAIAPPALMPDATLITIWLDKLPRYVALTLAQQPNTPLAELLDAADHLHASYVSYGGLPGMLAFDPGTFKKVTPPAPPGRGRGRGRGKKSDSEPQSPGQKKKSIHFLVAQRQQEELLQEERDATPPYSSHGSSCSDPPALASGPVDVTPRSHYWCYYHFHFGANAKQCRPPCQHPNAARR